MTHRTYLSLKLIFEVISKEIGITKKKLTNIIERLPSTVDEAYEAILSRGKDQKRARKLLHIIVAAVRPFTIKEMNIALEIEANHRSYEDLDLEKDERFEATVRDICGVFVTVINQKIYLIHQTARQFLITKNSELSSGWKWSLHPTDSDLVLARFCLIYLFFDAFRTLLLAPATAKVMFRTPRWMFSPHFVRACAKLERQYGFFRYAGQFWAAHYRRAQFRATTDVFSLACYTCDPNSELFHNWFSFFRLTRGNFPVKRWTSSMMVACYLGLETVAARLLEKEITKDTIKKAPYYTQLLSSVLYWALSFCPARLKEFDVGLEQRTPSRTLFEMADEIGLEAVEAALITSYEIHTLSKTDDSEKTTTLVLWNTIKQLIERYGGEDDAGVRDEHTPLTLCTFRGDLNIIKSLLQNSAAMNTNTRYERTPLSYAAESGNDQVVELLVKERVNVKLGGYGMYGGPRAVYLPLDRFQDDYSFQQVIKLLLAKCEAPLPVVFTKNNVGRVIPTNGCSIFNTIPGWKQKEGVWYAGRTPLSYAVEKGHVSVVRSLLRYPHFWNYKGLPSRGRIPLSFATENGHRNVVRRLLTDDVLADANGSDIADDFGQTPLSCAAGNMALDTIELLLRVGADPQSADHEGRTSI